MGRLTPARRWRGVGRIVGALLMLALLVFLGAAAVSFPLHQSVCPDAGSPTDSCAVVAFAAGLVESPLSLVLGATVILTFLIALLMPCEADSSMPLFRLYPSHSPPFALQVR